MELTTRTGTEAGMHLRSYWRPGFNKGVLHPRNFWLAVHGVYGMLKPMGYTYMENHFLRAKK